MEIEIIMVELLDILDFILGALKGAAWQSMKKLYHPKMTKMLYFSECGGGVEQVFNESVILTVATVSAALALLMSCLSVIATLLFCKYK